MPAKIITINSVADIQWDDIDRIQHVPRKLLRGDPLNPRKNLSGEKMEELIESIREDGIKTPLKIRPPTADDKNADFAYLLAGHRRLFAARELELATLPCMVRPEGLTPAERIEELIGDNDHHEDLPPVDLARAYQGIMRERNCTQQDLALRLKKSPITIGKVLKLLQLPEEAQVLVNKGDVSRGAAELILRLTEDPKEQVQLACRVQSGELSTRKLEDLIKKAPTTYQGSQASGKNLLEALLNGSDSKSRIFERRFPFGDDTGIAVTVTCNKKTLSDDEIREVLRQAMLKVSITVD